MLWGNALGIWQILYDGRVSVSILFGLGLSLFSGCSSPPPAPRDVIVQGATAWNLWRSENPDVVPDLSGIDLEGADLRAARLESTNLTGAVLRDARLSTAWLNSADLSGADLTGADLSAASLAGVRLSGARLAGANLALTDLSDAELDKANLPGATLTGARLSRANLSHGDLSGADLSGADLGEAVFISVDLSNATIDNIVNWEAIPTMQDANIYRVVRAPRGFKDFALSHGAKKVG